MNIIIEHPLISALTFAAFLVVVVILAVEVAISRRLREIKAMFADALFHAKSFDPVIERLKDDRARDAETMISILQSQALLTSKVQDLEEWKDDIEHLNVIRASRGTK